MLAAVAILPAVPLALELWLRVADAWVLVPFGLAASGFVAMTCALKRRRAGWFAALGAGVVVSMFLYLLLHTAPAGYRQMSTRDIVRAIDVSPLRDGRFSFCSNSKPSFLFYAGMEDAPALDVGGHGHSHGLAEWLLSGRPRWCLVSGEKHLSQLKQACPNAFRIVAAEGDCWLVANDTAAPASAASAGNGTSAETGK
jgi:hypothetical protein